MTEPDLGTHFGTARAIAALDRNDPDFEDIVSCYVKKYVHHEKLSVYHRMFLDMKYGPRRPRAFKKHVKHIVKEWVECKILTHEEFISRPYTKMVAGLFDWKKNK